MEYFHRKYRMIKNVLRKKIVLSKREALENKDFTIISSDCTGGVIYHELNQQFMSPTINMFMMAEDFITFCEDIEFWINQPMKSVDQTEYPYPVAQLGEEKSIKLYLVHYDTFEEALEMWNRRKERINYNNMYLIMNDRNNCNFELMKRFDNLPYKNKILFTHLPQPEIKSSYCMKGMEEEEYVKTMTAFRNKFSLFKNYDQFDVVGWLNGKNLS